MLGHSGYRGLTIDTPVTVTNGKINLTTTKHHAITGFAILDPEVYQEKKQTSDEIKNEEAEKIMLMDTVEPMGRSYLRKPLNIVGWSPNLLKNASGEVLNLVFALFFTVLYLP